MLTTITTDDHDTVTNALLGLLSSHPYREDSTGNNHPSCVLPFTTLVELPDYPLLPEPMRERWAILTDRPGTDAFEVTLCTNHDHARTIFDTLRTYYKPIHEHFTDPTHPTPEPTSPPPHHRRPDRPPPHRHAPAHHPAEQLTQQPGAPSPRRCPPCCAIQTQRRHPPGSIPEGACQRATQPLNRAHPNS